MIVAFSVAPSNDNPNGSVHDAVAAAVKIVRESGLPNRTSSMFTEMRHLGQGKSMIAPAGVQGRILP